MPQKKDLRSSTRKPIQFDLKFARKWSSDEPRQENQWTGKALDICQNGMGFLAGVPLKKGEILKVHLPVNSSGIPIPVFSEVRWVKSETAGNRVGLQFLS
jgi:hypothetical protein